MRAPSRLTCHRCPQDCGYYYEHDDAYMAAEMLEKAILEFDNNTDTQYAQYGAACEGVLKNRCFVVFATPLTICVIGIRQDGRMCLETLGHEPSQHSRMGEKAFCPS